VHFAEGAGRRDYLIFHRPEKANRWGWRQPGGWWVRSLSPKDVAVPAEFDLRERADAEALAEILGAADLAAPEPAEAPKKARRPAQPAPRRKSA
jgi:hypothetical protein